MIVDSGLLFGPLLCVELRPYTHQSKYTVS